MIKFAKSSVPPSTIHRKSPCASRLRMDLANLQPPYQLRLLKTCSLLWGSSNVNMVRQLIVIPVPLNSLGIVERPSGFRLGIQVFSLRVPIALSPEFGTAIHTFGSLTAREDFAVFLPGAHRTSNDTLHVLCSAARGARNTFPYVSNGFYCQNSKTTASSAFLGSKIVAFSRIY
ncbi:hypothetical protein GALMADRAFT_217451 [Galerina marginata CBS 339.88]|uniref:Uncharacterized protein n=1 Tax=Galerina marginata (strain CBS 339.88) TaxID=685588 RepID=A0A067S6X5_GALM3|nr:hypothetical protein GALMADRAFT_217451 [Galerina marginata CBS 339.88]